MPTHLLPWLVAVALAIPFNAAASVYKYHPSTTLKMGGGFDPLRPDRGFAQCLEKVESVALTAGPPETNFDVSLVKSRRELYHHLHLDASLSASYGLFSASASFSLDQEYSFGQNDIMWVVKATTDYGRYALPSPTLNELGKSLSRDPRFPEHCGREYVFQERRVAHAVAIYSLHTLTETERNEVHAALGASFTGNVFAVGGSVQLDEITKSLKEVYELKITVYSIGGEGVTKLSDLATQTTLAEVKTTLGKYVTGLTRPQATPVEFVTASWRSLGVPLHPPEMAFRRIALEEYYFMFQDGHDRLRRYGERLREFVSTPTTGTANQQQIAAFTAQYTSLAGRLTELQKRALACLEPSASEKMDLGNSRTASLEPNTRTDGGCTLNLVFEPLPTVPLAEFENRWVRFDAFGNSYSIDVYYDAPNAGTNTDLYIYLTAGVAGGLQANIPEDPLSVRFTGKFDPITLPSNTQKKGDEFLENNRTFRMVRHPNENAQRERLRLYYEVLQRVCVRFCFGQE